MLTTLERRMEADRLVLFDIDGTLLSAAGLGGRAIVRALTEITGRAIDLAGYSYAGRTDPQIVRDLLGRAELDAAAIENALPRVLDLYVEGLARDMAGADGPHLHPGIGELLARLDADPRTLTGLLTGNVERGAQIKLDHFGIRHYFELGAYGSDSADRNQLVAIAAARARLLTGIDYAGDAIVVVGDTPRDIACARHAGVRCVAVATGTIDLETLRQHRPDALFADFSATEQVVAAIGGAPIMPAAAARRHDR
jgi:phosphoglycolate phosphatase-like HAD superfamily hydrolase